MLSLKFLVVSNEDESFSSDPMVTSLLRLNYLHIPFVLLVFLIFVYKVIL